MNRSAHTPDLPEEEGQTFYTTKGCVMVMAITAYRCFDDKPAMRKCRGLLKEMMSLAKTRGYKNEQQFRDAFKVGNGTPEYYNSLVGEVIEAVGERAIMEIIAGGPINPRPIHNQ